MKCFSRELQKRNDSTPQKKKSEQICAGGTLALMATVCFVVVFRKFQVLGGNEHYKAPQLDFHTAEKTETGVLKSSLTQKEKL